MPRGVYERTPEMNAVMSETLRNSDAAKAKADAMRSVPRSPETKSNISAGRANSAAVKAANDALRGVPLSSEHCAAISRGLEESDAIAAMVGGDDIVNHHIAYDFARIDTLIVRITRKFHGLIHHPKGIQFHQRGYSLID